MTTPSAVDALGELDSLMETMRRLRDPKGGCPWDLEQTHTSLRNTLLEETYETMEALESDDVSAMVEELGDLLIQVAFHAQIGVDNGTFSMADVARHAREKLVRRHPHVFGEAQVTTAEEVKRQWDRIKGQERQDQGRGERSILDGVPKSMPALAYAQEVQARVGRTGLTDEDAVELGALAGEVAAIAQAPIQERRAGWLGDLLFSVVSAARALDMEAEQALQEANGRFYRRFKRVEEACREQGISPERLSPQEKARLWSSMGGA